MAWTDGQMMGLSMGIQGISDIGSAYAQASAAQAQGQFQKRAFEMNRRLVLLAADDAIRQGEKDAASVRRRGRQIIGAQRAYSGAQGIEVNEGSALELQEDTAAGVAEDELMIRNNAWRQAWGFRVSANNMRMHGEMAEIVGGAAHRNTLVTGGLQFARQASEGAYTYAKG